LSLPNSLFLKAFSFASRRVGWFAVVLVTLAGCSLLRPSPELSVPDVGGFVVKGRLAVRQGDDAFSSSFIWQHAVGHDEIELWGPMGQGRSRLVGDPDQVTIYTAKGEVLREPDPEAGMKRWLGFSLPLSAMTHWIVGERAPGFPTADLISDANGDLTLLEQLTWRIEFSGYRTRDDGRRLPGRIIAIRGDVKVTLLPGEWSFAAQPTSFDTL
jgi:outer membrane lipoprotein LolB